MKKIISVLTAALCITFVAGQAWSADQFFEGKTMRIMVGSAPGGGYDAYSRALARHWGRYIPGNPNIIVENMLGAGGLICGNYVYKVAKPDGLTLGKFNGGFFFGQALEQPGIEFDARKFIFVGAIAKEDTIVYFTEKSGITNFDKWLTASPAPKLGGDSPGSFAPDGVIRVLASALNVPVQLVSGYKGQGPIRLAMDSGELAGTSASWYSIRHARSESFKKGELIAVVSNVPKPFADLPSVPTAISLAKSEEGRKLIESYIHTNRVFARPFVLPPGVPADRVQTLRDAFVRTLQDKEFLAEMQKAQLTVDPVTHQELTEAVAGVFKTDPALLAKLKTILYQ